MAGAKMSTVLSALLLSLGGAAAAGLYFGLLAHDKAPSAPGPGLSARREPAVDDYHISADPKLGVKPAEALKTPRRIALPEKKPAPKPRPAPKPKPKAPERAGDEAIGDLVTETARLYGAWLKEYQEATRSKRLSPAEQRKLGLRYQKEFMPRFIQLAADKAASMEALLDYLADPETENRAQVAQMLKSLANYPSASSADTSAINDKIFDLLGQEGDPELRSQLLMGLQVKTEEEQRRSLELFADLAQNSKDEGLRAMALYKLARFSVDGAHEQVRRVLTDVNEPARVRVGAIQAIDFSRWPKGLSLFRDLTLDPNASVRQSVYSRAHQMTTSPELRQTLQDALINERNPALISSLKYSLQIHGDEQTMLFLQDVARNQELDAPRRAAAQQAFAVIKQRLEMKKKQDAARR